MPRRPSMFSAISAELARERELELRHIDRDGRLAGLLRFRRKAAAVPVPEESTLIGQGTPPPHGL